METLDTRRFHIDLEGESLVSVIFAVSLILFAVATFKVAEAVNNGKRFVRGITRY